jgi:hypothetical protein
MAPTLKLGRQEDRKGADRLLLRRHSLTETCNIRVIVQSRHPSILRITNNRRSSTRDLVGSHTDSLTAATHSDTEVNLTPSDSLTHCDTELRVVRALSGMGTNIRDHVPLTQQPLLQCGLQNKACVIGTDCDTHHDALHLTRPDPNPE